VSLCIPRRISTMMRPATTTIAAAMRGNIIVLRCSRRNGRVEAERKQVSYQITVRLSP
jgi:hypothetical protein